MSHLDLPVCPICHRPNSLSRQTQQIQGTAYTWYQCQQCASVLLWLGGDRWAYQKIGLADKTGLLKKPLTAAQLLALVAPAEPVRQAAPLAPPSPSPIPSPPPKAAVREAPAEPAPSPQPAAGPRPEAQAPPPEERPKRSRRLLWVVVLAGLVLIAAAVAVVLLGLPGNEPPPTAPAVAQATDAGSAAGTPQPAAATATPRPTTTWVPTLTPLPPTPTPTVNPEIMEGLNLIKDAVVEMRGLEEIQPINPTFISRQEMMVHQADRFDRDYPADQVAAQARVWAAFGLIPDPYDLEGVLRSLYIRQVIGLYENETDTLYIMPDISSGSFDLFAEVTYAHEYALALQDQHTDLAAFLDRSQLNDDEFMARRALVEGIASHVTADYFFTLPATNNEIWSMTTRDLRGQGETWYSRPLIILFTFPTAYSNGSTYVENLRESGGWEAVDAVFARPPRSTEQILHVEKYLADDEPTIVSLPPLTDTLGAGWHLVKANTLGELQLGFSFSEQLSISASNEAIAGWDGDAYALYANGDMEVLVFATVWDSGPEREEFVDAYQLYTELREGQPSTRSGEAETWWESPDRCVVLTWGETNALIVMAPDVATADKVLAATR